jgi:uncharacterized membrane protein
MDWEAAGRAGDLKMARALFWVYLAAFVLLVVGLALILTASGGARNMWLLVPAFGMALVIPVILWSTGKKIRSLRSAETSRKGQVPARGNPDERPDNPFESEQS